MEKFSLFGKKTVDENKVAEFVCWFVDNCERIQLSVENIEKDRQETMKVLDEVEAHLATVYRDGYKGRIEFDYGGKDNDWKLNLYHMDKPFLINAPQMIADKINIITCFDCNSEIPQYMGMYSKSRIAKRELHLFSQYMVKAPYT